MELNLLPQNPETTVFEGEGGGYYTWTAPAIIEAAVGAGKLVLHPHGFALPHYSDARKIGYVLQGSCTVGLVLPNDPEEKVIIINKGDAIPVPTGAISWWFNRGDSDVTIIFLGTTSQSNTPGQFNYFFLGGAVGILRGFSTKFIKKIYNLTDARSKELAEAQSNPIIIKIDDTNVQMPYKSNCNKQDHVIQLDVSNAKGSTRVEITSKDSPLIDEMGLSPSLVKLEPGTLLDPSYSTEHRILYVIKGECEIQIVGLNGETVLNGTVNEGQLVVVPKFLVAALLATNKGAYYFCLSKSSRPVSGQIAGVYKAISSSVLEAALNVTPEFVKAFKSNI